MSFVAIFQEYWRDFLEGTLLTIQLVAIAAILGLALAVPVALGRLSETLPVRWFATGYSIFFRARRFWCSSS